VQRSEQEERNAMQGDPTCSLGSTVVRWLLADFSAHSHGGLRRLQRLGKLPAPLPVLGLA